MDTFEWTATTKEDPANGAFAISADNDNDLAIYPRALSVAAAGTVSVVTLMDETVTIYVAAGVMFPQRCKRVRSSGTSATGIVGHY